MRIAGVDIPDNKKLQVALTYIFGIGQARAKEILSAAKISTDKKTQELTDNEAGAVRVLVEKYRIEGDLKREIAGNIKRLKEIKSYRGTRHIKKLPARGQRTKSNTRTVKGNIRVTMGSGRRKLEKT